MLALRVAGDAAVASRPYEKANAFLAPFPGLTGFRTKLRRRPAETAIEKRFARLRGHQVMGLFFGPDPGRGACVNE